MQLHVVARLPDVRIQCHTKSTSSLIVTGRDGRLLALIPRLPHCITSTARQGYYGLNVPALFTAFRAVVVGDGGLAPPHTRTGAGVRGWSRLGFAVPLGALAFCAAVPQEVSAAILTDGVLLAVLLRVADRNLMVYGHGMIDDADNGGGPSGSPLCCSSHRVRRTAFQRRPYALLRPR